MALHLGKFVSEVDRRCTYKELRNWSAYFEENPVGQDRIEAIVAHISATIATIISRQNGGRGHKFTTDDFMIPRRLKKKTPEEVAASLTAYAMALSKKKGFKIKDLRSSDKIKDSRPIDG